MGAFPRVITVLLGHAFYVSNLAHPLPSVFIVEFPTFIGVRQSDAAAPGFDYLKYAAERLRAYRRFSERFLPSLSPATVAVSAK